MLDFLAFIKKWWDELFPMIQEFYHTLRDDLGLIPNE